MITDGGRSWLVDDDLRRIDPDAGRIRTIVPLKRSDTQGMEAEAGPLWSVGGGDVARIDLCAGSAGRAPGSLKLGEYDTESVAVGGALGGAVGGGAVWVVGAGTAEGGPLTRIKP